MDMLLLVTKEDNNILNNYSLVSKNTLNEKDYEKYLKKYPAIENEDLYILKELTKEQQENLNSTMAKPLMMLSTITNEELKTIPKEQLEVMLKNVEEQLNGMNESILEQAAVTIIKKEYKEIGINTEDIQNRYIFLTGLQMLGVALISMVSAVIIMLLSSRVAAKLRKNIKRQSI